MRRALKGLMRYIATVRVARHRHFVFLSAATLADSRLIVFARDDLYIFGILESRIHELWSLRTCSWHGVGNDPTYTPSTTFETFPFPRPDDLRREAVSQAAKALHESRDSLLKTDPRRTLTSLYNDRPTWLAKLHEKLDQAVFEAYGWPGDLSDDAILGRLLELNFARPAAVSHKVPGQDNNK